MKTDSPRPAWWPTAEQKLHADAGCAHPEYCNVETRCAHGRTVASRRDNPCPPGLATCKVSS